MDEEEKTVNREKIFSVSDYIEILNQGLKNFRAKIIGEVSKVDFGPTGNVYFYLKDEKDQGVLKCMIDKDKYDIYLYISYISRHPDLFHLLSKNKHCQSDQNLPYLLHQ